MSGVVNVAFYIGGGECRGWWMSGWWMSHNRCGQLKIDWIRISFGLQYLIDKPSVFSIFDWRTICICCNIWLANHLGVFAIYAKTLCCNRAEPAECIVGISFWKQAATVNLTLMPRGAFLCHGEILFNAGENDIYRRRSFKQKLKVQREEIRLCSKVQRKRGDEMKP